MEDSKPSKDRKNSCSRFGIPLVFQLRATQGRPLLQTMLLVQPKFARSIPTITAETLHFFKSTTTATFDYCRRYCLKQKRVENVCNETVEGAAAICCSRASSENISSENFWRRSRARTHTHTTRESSHTLLFHCTHHTDTHVARCRLSIVIFRVIMSADASLNYVNVFVSSLNLLR